MTALTARRSTPPARRDGALMIGTAEQSTEKILDAHAELGIARFIGQFD